MKTAISCAYNRCWPVTDVPAVALVLFCGLIIWVPRMRGPIDLRYDAGVYYILGTSLAETGEYRLLSEPGEIHGIQYPPLLSAFVAAHQRILGSVDPAIVGHWLRASFGLLTVIYVVATYALARQFLTPGRSVFVALITAFYLHTTFLSDLLFAEIPFGLATVLFFVVGRAGGTMTRFGLQAAFGAAAFLLRSAGIALLAAWVMEAAIQRRWIAAVSRGVIAAIPLVAWQSYIARVQASEEFRHPAYAYQRATYQFYNVSYAENIRLIDPFRPELGLASPVDLARRMVGNLAALPASIGESVTAPYRFWESLDWVFQHQAHHPSQGAAPHSANHFRSSEPVRPRRHDHAARMDHSALPAGRAGSHLHDALARAVHALRDPAHPVLRPLAGRRDRGQPGGRPAALAFGVSHDRVVPVRTVPNLGSGSADIFAII